MILSMTNSAIYTHRFVSLMQVIKSAKCTLNIKRAFAEASKLFCFTVFLYHFYVNEYAMDCLQARGDKIGYIGIPCSVAVTELTDILGEEYALNTDYHNSAFK